MNEKEERVCVRFYFICNRSDRFFFTKAQWEKTRIHLAKNWPEHWCTGDKFGINFANVMYYIIED